ncbi:MAG: class I SAM-dependent methyltransferase [Gemmatimonadetes bacterium]|nr:class I SAM-dependent methyltransferase [Gemmatimonadota bacterium]
MEHGDLDLDVLHPGGLEITRELAHRCRILPGTRVLDVASGTGESACLLAEELGARVVGLDVSDRMVGRARAKAVHQALAEVEFLPADAHRLPFEDGTFDAVLCECTLCLFEKERALADLEAIDRSHLLRNWIGLTRKELGGLRQWRVFLRIVRRWGIRGLGPIWESVRIFRSGHLGYAVAVGRKP